MATPSLRSLEKSLALLREVVQAKTARSLSALAWNTGLPLSTAHRISVTLERTGFITRVRRGHYLPGPTLLQLTTPTSINQVLKALGTSVISKLARRSRCTAHLGVLENGMVTYLLKIGRDRTTIFTKEGTQLEAYCTGIGKMLLANLSAPDLDEYLSQGPFIPLTPRTLIETKAIRAALKTIKVSGFAIDNGEMDKGLRCLAVPVCDQEQRVVAAVSISMRQNDECLDQLTAHLGTLQEAALELRRAMIGKTTKRASHLHSSGKQQLIEVREATTTKISLDRKRRGRG